MFHSFRKKIKTEEEPLALAPKVEDDTQEIWKSHKLQFEKIEQVIDPSIVYEQEEENPNEEEDQYVVIDPRKFKAPDPSTSGLSKHQIRLKAKKNLDKW